VRRVRYPTPTAVVVYILPRFGHGPLSSCVRAFVCVYVFFGVYECVRVFVSVRARFVQGRSFGLQARREIKGARRRLVSGAHTHTHTSPEYIIFVCVCVCVRSQVNPDRDRFLISSLSLSNSYISVYVSRA